MLRYTQNRLARLRLHRFRFPLRRMEVDSHKPSIDDSYTLIMLPGQQRLGHG